ncbi:divergent polysaccharide deacetylase family protein [Kordiimonas laminariae]|uniref:divergent polysaccharide deacetylase family protein n=1 Tax=Kordiimonas laminariae TaxID=2917717 RepID=UPI001FF3E169|nr:divergent polysaccharide deacetylase family protein [Kordiimonas laminariae]
MPSNLNALLIAWALSLITVVGGLVLLEAVHTPMAKEQPASTNTHAEDTDTADTMEKASMDAPAQTTSQTDTPQQQTQEQATLNQPIQAPIENNNSTQPATQQPSLPAPGQAAPVNNQPAPQTATASIQIEAIPALLEETSQGFLPKIADDGRKPRNVYAAPQPSDRNSPRVALIMTNLGKLSRNTKRAIDGLPTEVGLAFSPYSARLNEWGVEARTKGFEVYLTIPMEPVNYPQNDPGPFSLLTARTTRENINLLKSSLARFTGYVGVINHMGSRFTASADSIRPILAELNRRGLMFVDSRSSQYSVAATMSRAIGMPTAINNRNLDEVLSESEIMSQLQELEKRARAQGAALGHARAYPVTIRAINTWKDTLADKGILFVPVSAVADLQPLPR